MREQIAANRRRSIFLVIILAALLLSLGYVLAEAYVPGAGGYGLLIGALIFAVQYGIYLTSPESILLAGLGAREMHRDDSPRLFNVVEEMKIASGLEHMPRIYLIDDDSPNAFAIGRNVEDSIVAVTSGLMHRLDRDELQGVIAHEVGHLKNRDVQFMTLAGVMLGSILILSEGAMRSVRYGAARGSTRSSSRGGNGGGNGLFIILAIVLVILAPILARLLYFAMSRAREYMADASAALYTRYPPGLAGALRKIAGSARSNVSNSALAPMYIVSPRAAISDSGGWFSTHPPTAERVRILNNMGGAGFAAYEAAFEGVKGRKLLKQSTIAESPAAPVRAPLLEGVPGLGDALAPQQTEKKAAVKALVHSLYGYVKIECDCGGLINVPTSYHEPQVRCIRCGRKQDMPSAEERHAHILQKTAGAAAAGGTAVAAAPLEPMIYQRKSPGKWENFRCTCDATVQLSPQFIAPRVTCRKCGRPIEIKS